MKTIYRLPVLVLACWLCLSTAVWGSNTPPPVTGLVAVHNGSTVPVTWDAVDNIDGYHFQARIHGGSWWATVPVPTMPQPTVTILAAEAGRDYDVRVRTHKDGATSAWTSASTLTPPVTGLAAVHNGSTVTVTWNAVAGVGGYHFQSRVAGGNWSPTVPISSSTTTASIQSAEVAKDYDVRVRTHKDGAGTSVWRSASTRPPAVTGLAAVHHGGYVTATWTAPAVAAGVHATWSVAGTNRWFRVSNPQAASLRIDGLNPALTYIVAVRVRTSSGHWGPWTNSTPAACSGACTPPGSVGSLTAVHNGSTVTVTWDAPAGAVDYHVTYTSDDGASWSLADQAATGTSLNITGTDAAKTYIVGVRARNDSGYGPWTNSDKASQ